MKPATGAARPKHAPETPADSLIIARDGMPYGLSIWDEELNLVLANERYLRMYNLPGDQVRPGITLHELVTVAVAMGNHPGRTVEEMFPAYRERLTWTTDPDHPLVYERPLRDRIVKVTHVRRPGLGWINIHEDVTDDKNREQALREREADLAQQNMRFEAAINNMSQGLCMFDADRRLIICNRRFAEMYRTPPELVQPGTPLEAILEDRVRQGFLPNSGGKAYIRSRMDLVARKTDTVDVVELEDGRVISVLHHPMADGGWVATHQDITQQRRAEARIHHLARHDALTDLPNRIQFREHLEQAEVRIARAESVALHYIDLDHYKTINDLFGHAIGDAVLIRVAERLVEACRKGDIVARLGGDEFAILQGNARSDEDAAGLAGRIVTAMAQPMNVEGHEVAIGASVGIAIAPRDGRSAEALMQNADLALYRVKADGRSGFCFFRPEMEAALQERLAFEADLRSAIAAGQLGLVYQPVLSLERQRVSTAEALLRWSHPTRGTLLPDVFVPIAEETGLIVPIGEWVLARACRDAVAWPDHVRVSVNLSPIQFRRRTLVDHVRSALEASGLPPARLELEVTEAALLADMTGTVRTLRQLHDIGVRIVLEDFGTGLADFRHLRAFPFDKFKIDRSFIRDMASWPDSVAIIEGLIGVARSLGMATTAEGIETEEQLDLVRDRGCTEAQGYLLSPPLPLAGLASLIAAQEGSDEGLARRTIRSA